MILASIIFAIIALLIGSYTDLKKREVHDYVSYSLIFLGFIAAIIHSIINWEYIVLLHTVMGFALGLGIAYAMFYLGQWGGGDSKLIMGLGTIIGFNPFNTFGSTDYWLLILLMNIIFVGAIYGLLWSIYLAIKHRAQFSKSLKLWSKKKHILLARRVLLIFSIVYSIIVLVFFPLNIKLFFMSFIAIIFMLFYVWLFVKIIEESCMIKNVPIGALTEGDWIFKEVYIGKRLIVGPKDLGISKQQIVLLNKYKKAHKIGKIQVKEGIPFIPAFLFAFIITLIMYYTETSILSIISGIL